MALIEMDPNGAWAKSPRWARVTMIGVGTGLVLLTAFIALIPEVQSAAAPQPTAAEVREASMKAAERREAGDQCLSPWDGSITNLTKMIKNAARDPDSVEIAQTSMSMRQTDGTHHFLVRYRARNGFGGMNVEQVEGDLDGDTCQVLRVSEPKEV